MGHRKSSVALLIVFDRNFYCLARDYFSAGPKTVSWKYITQAYVQVHIKGIG